MAGDYCLEVASEFAVQCDCGAPQFGNSQGLGKEAQVGFFRRSAEDHGGGGAIVDDYLSTGADASQQTREVAGCVVGRNVKRRHISR